MIAVLMGNEYGVDGGIAQPNGRHKFKNTFGGRSAINQQTVVFVANPSAVALGTRGQYRQLQRVRKQWKQVLGLLERGGIVGVKLAVVHLETLDF